MTRYRAIIQTAHGEVTMETKARDEQHVREIIACWISRPAAEAAKVTAVVEMESEQR